MILALLLLAASAFAQPVLPELPRVYVQTGFLPVPLATFTASSCATLQAAVDAAAAVTTDSEVVYSDLSACTINLVLRARTNPTDGWVYIHPSNMGALPARGTRITTAASGSIPKLQTNTTGRVLGNDNDNVSQAARLAHHYWITGLELTTTGAQVAPSNFVYDMVILDGSSDAGILAGDENYIPHHIVFDRCYIHGIADQTKHVGKGIRGNAYHLAVVDSYISEIHDAASGGENQAFQASRTPGPIKILNSYLGGATENFMLGGNTGYSGITASDIEFRNNFVVKQVAWRTYSPLPAAKNLFELKEGVRVLIDGNLFENSWQGGQYGFGLVLTPRTGQSGIWKSVTDVTARNNVWRHIGGAVNVLLVDDGCPAFNMTVNVSGTAAIRVSGSQFVDVESGLNVYVNNLGPYTIKLATTLASAVVDGSVTTITLTDSTVGTVGAILKVESEYMLVTGVSGADRTVTRGVSSTGTPSGSTAAAHAVNVRVFSSNLGTLGTNLGTLTSATLVSVLPCTILRRVLIQNNLFDDVADTWGTPAGLWQFTGFAEFTLDRNTMINAGSAQPPVFQAWQGPPACDIVIGQNWQFTRNVFSGYPGGDCSPAPANIYNSTYVKGYIVPGNNLLINITGPQQTAWTAWDATAAYAVSEAAVGFSADYFNITGSYASQGSGARLSCYDEAAIRAGTPVTKNCSPTFVRLYTP